MGANIKIFPQISYNSNQIHRIEVFPIENSMSDIYLRLRIVNDMTSMSQPENTGKSELTEPNRSVMCLVSIKEL